MRKLLQYSLLLTLIVLFGATTHVWANIDVTPEEAKYLIDTNPELIIIDIRTQEDYCSGHIPGALNYSAFWGVFQAFYNDFPKDAEIIIFCASRHATEYASAILDDAGYLYVYDAGAMSEWTYETVDCNNCIFSEDTPPEILGPLYIGLEDAATDINGADYGMICWKQTGLPQMCLPEPTSTPLPVYIEPNGQDIVYVIQEDQDCCSGYLHGWKYRAESSTEWTYYTLSTTPTAAGGLFLRWNWAHLQVLPALGVYEIAVWATDCTGKKTEKSFYIDLIEFRE